MERTIYFTSISIMIILVFLILYGKNGFIDGNNLRLQEKTIIIENDAIYEENKVLERKIHRLKNDLSYIEHIARHELGMVAKDELVFRFQDIKQKERKDK
ncbi:MAG: septum formation initiator family protein [Desulfamplus sp.]|nr:septum formation initiator family protein [Desulfamplus sp.]MBF0411727.1 septum formation initiator family protein [Desulfamplus sp.]